MMAAIVVPARSFSMARTWAFLVPLRALASVPEPASTGSGRFDDLRLAVFAGRERVTVLSLDFVLVMGASQGLRDAIRRTTSAPPRCMTRRGSAQKHASAAPSPHSNARFEEECQSISSNMIALAGKDKGRLASESDHHYDLALGWLDDCHHIND
jgi:hypothetical protein